MNKGLVLHLFFGLLVVVGGLCCFGPWYDLPLVLTALSLGKFLGLVGASLAALWAFASFAAGDQQRRQWLLLALGLASYSIGQGILAYHQIFLEVRVPFPSWGDLFFVGSYPFILSALYSFCLISFRSGLPLGSGPVFFSPAIAVGVLLLLSAYPLMAPILSAGDPWDETALNLIYPLVSFLALAPCTVMIRVGWKFMGGTLLTVWLPLTLGFAAVLVSDVAFALFTSLDLSWLEAVVDFLYLSGYLLIFLGGLNEVRLLRGAS